MCISPPCLQSVPFGLMPQISVALTALLSQPTTAPLLHVASLMGADLLKMSREDLIQICGLADGIQLLSAIKGSPLCVCIQPRLTLGALPEKSSLLYNVTPQQISHVYRQGPTGIHMLVSDEMVQNFTEETRFVIRTLKDENNDGYPVAQLVEHGVCNASMVFATPGLWVRFPRGASTNYYFFKCMK
ncbi:transcription factor CP2-like protein 1 isoform X1 [Salmo trutta]|uniref:transcription factor CP2-like protein 1 isoform X1 n=1 Tax=Salmo trutta TaxID=8032 RepID=UPI001131CBFE|nr:transcription factor CP2-like protein 1 isoform X1 [Salmo trutta]XP_029567415.1 transcription factor CP2-like protein 1 isoform X1 [Salmo trutta]